MDDVDEAIISSPAVRGGAVGEGRSGRATTIRKVRAWRIDSRVVRREVQYGGEVAMRRTCGCNVPGNVDGRGKASIRRIHHGFVRGLSRGHAGRQFFIRRHSATRLLVN